MNYYFAGAEAEDVYLMLKDVGVKKALFSFYGMSTKLSKFLEFVQNIYYHD